MSVVFSFTSGEFLRIIITVSLNHTYLLLTLNLIPLFSVRCETSKTFYFKYIFFAFLSRLLWERTRANDNEDIKKLCIEAIELKARQQFQHMCEFVGLNWPLFIIKTLTTIWFMRVSPKKHTASIHSTTTSCSILLKEKSDNFFCSKKKEHDTCNYVCHNHKFMLDF